MRLQEIKDICSLDFRDDRKDFIQSWLREMPAFAGTLDTFPPMLINIESLKNMGLNQYL